MGETIKDSWPEYVPLSMYYIVFLEKPHVSSENLKSPQESPGKPKNPKEIQETRRTPEKSQESQRKQRSSKSSWEMNKMEKKTHQ